MAKTYKIHPAIGVSRLGNSEKGFYFEPETVAGLPTEIRDGKEVPIESFRDDEKKLKRGACRFQIYVYDDAHPNGKRIRIGEEGVADIEWTVHLANKKPVWYAFEQLQGEHGYGPSHPLRNAHIRDAEERRKRLIIDPGPQTIKGKGETAEFTLGKGRPGYPQTFPPADLIPFPITTLGEIRTDVYGNFFVLGGLGSSGTTDRIPNITSYANNDNWYDDVSDGPVQATLVMEDGSRIEVDAPSWVVVTPPAYVPQITNVVTAYDVVYDLAVREFDYRPDIYTNGLWNQRYTPNWQTEIEPILKRADPYKWVMANMPQFAHLFDYVALGDPAPEHHALRQRLFNVIRPYDTPNTQKESNQVLWLMPLLAGDNPLTTIDVSNYVTLTETQYFLLQQWAEGRFGTTKPDGEALPPGAALDRAVLENCVGAAFCPGIEMTWIVRNSVLYSEPFRIKHKKPTDAGLSLGEDLREGAEPGDLGKRMALPWQADFNECSTQGITHFVEDKHTVAWWPVQRPLMVRTKANRFQAVEWTRGFVSTPSHNANLDLAGDLQMVTDWKNLGFIINLGTPENPELVEVERNEEAINHYNPPAV